MGNSLVEDPNYADKPFNWKKEFEEIFRENGFDIVIGKSSIRLSSWNK